MRVLAAAPGPRADRHTAQVRPVNLLALLAVAHGGAAERNANGLVARARLGRGDLHAKRGERARAADPPSPRGSSAPRRAASSRLRSAPRQRSSPPLRRAPAETARPAPVARRVSRAARRARRRRAKPARAMRTATGNGSVPACVEHAQRRARGLVVDGHARRGRRRRGRQMPASARRDRRREERRRT